MQQTGIPALITGASSGIGAALARTHAAAGGDLVLVARRADRLEALKAELESAHGISVTILCEDLTDEAAPQRIYDAVKAAGITVSYLINNAGFGGVGRFDTRPWADDRDMMQVNMVALAALTRLFLPDFLAQNAGRILNVSSAAALTPGPMMAMYYASKAFVTSFSLALAEELRDTPVTVTAMMPGPVGTEFGKVAGTAKMHITGEVFPVEVAARNAYRAMLRGQMRDLSGMTPRLRFLIGLLRFVPQKPVLKFLHKLQDPERRG